MTGWRLAAAAAALLAWECGRPAPEAAYGAVPAQLRGRLRAEFTAENPGGSGRFYRAATEALVRIRRADTAGGVVVHELQVDSVNYTATERDAAEQAFMRERLRRYRASWKTDRSGRVLEMTEEPELPRGDFTSRLGPMLAAALPVFPAPGAAADTQSLFDPAEASAALIQSRRGGDVRGGKDEVLGERDCALRLASGSGADLEGKCLFRFDRAAGFPVELALDLSGRLAVEAGDAGEASDAVRMRYRYRFELIEDPRTRALDSGNSATR